MCDMIKLSIIFKSKTFIIKWMIDTKFLIGSIRIITKAISSFWKTGAGYETIIWISTDLNSWKLTCIIFITKNAIRIHGWIFWKTFFGVACMLNGIAFYIHIIDQVFNTPTYIKGIVSLSADDPQFYSWLCIFINIKNIIIVKTIQSYFMGIGGLKDPVIHHETCVIPVFSCIYSYL